jgi:hypothetical protein
VRRSLALAFRDAPSRVAPSRYARRWSIGQDDADQAAVDASMSSDDGGGINFDPGPIVDKVKYGATTAQGYAQQAQNFANAAKDAASKEWTADDAAKAGAMIPVVGWVFTAGYGLAKLLPVGHATTTYPQWQGDAKDTWIAHYRMGAPSGWGGPGPPALVEGARGSFEAFFQGALWTAMQGKHEAALAQGGPYATTAGAALLTTGERLALLAHAIAAWNAAHSSAKRRTISRNFTWNASSGWGGPYMLASPQGDPIGESLPLPSAGSGHNETVSFVVNEATAIVLTPSLLFAIPSRPSSTFVELSPFAAQRFGAATTPASVASAIRAAAPAPKPAPMGSGAAVATGVGIAVAAVGAVALGVFLRRRRRRMLGQ